MNFTNKVIWITGASSGIGKALALQLSNLDCKLILSSRRESELNIVKSQCNNPNNVAILAFDLADYDMMKPLAKNAISIFGSIDILINNAGFVVTKPAWDVSENDRDSMVDTGFKGLFFENEALQLKE